jgi:DNA-binding transcriptional LysR family regulator
MDEFTRIRTFIKVVESGSFSAAARNVSSISSVARQVKSLEDDLGVRLLNRSTRSLSLTEAGRRFHERVCAVAHELDRATSEAKAHQEDVKGVLRVMLRVTAGTTVVVPALPRLLAKYPELELEISLDDKRHDLIANQIDVAMWLGELPHADLVARRLTPTQRIVCATPDYLRQHGVPRTPQDLQRHNCLVFAAPSYQNRWAFSRGDQQEEVEVHGNLRSDNGMVLLSAGMTGLGVIVVHEWMVRHLIDAEHMVRVLEDYTVHPRAGDAELYAVYPSSRGLSRKARVFIDFLVETFNPAAAQG